jgi:hypothetical protein
MFEVVGFPSVKSIYPKTIATSWMDFAAMLGNHQERANKSDGSLYSPVTYREYTTRGNRNVQYIWALVADLDGEAFEQADLGSYIHFAYTTWSHRDNDPHWHIVVPFEQAVPVQNWEEVWYETHERLRLKGDPATKDPARIFYLPQHEAGQPFRTHHSGWRFLDPTITDIAAPTRTFSTPTIRSTVQRTSTKKNRHVADPKWWDAPIDLSKYDGMTQHQIHRSIQIEWADFKKRAGIN